MTSPTPIEQQVEALIAGPQYARRQVEKESLLLPILREQCRHMAQACAPYARLLARWGADPGSWQSPADVPPLPVSVFKQFDLAAVPPERIVRVLRSSATTGQRPSRICIDKTTAFRQARALASILKEHIGPQRRPFLVLDAAESVASGEEISARGAAIRGVGNFATQTVFGLRAAAAGGLEPDFDAIADFFRQTAGQRVLLFGFTFLVWNHFVQAALNRGLSFSHPDAILLHSGGWKKLQAQAVTADVFRAQTSRVVGCPGEHVLDFYGMVEQVGTVFVDCSAGNKHAPAFADVVIRRPLSLAPVQPGETGIIEVISVLPTSYPGQALITEDQGVLLGVDDCPCGRRGTYFRFTQRIERAEIRGCGDTFAAAKRAS